MVPMRRQTERVSMMDTNKNKAVGSGLKLPDIRQK